MSAVVVVTGGAGFIGSHTVERLLARGRKVVVVDDFSSGKLENLAPWADPSEHGLRGRHPALEIIRADVAGSIASSLAPVVQAWGPISAIIHLAARVSVTESIADPLADLRINYGGSLQVLEYARCHHVPTVVLASSAAVYGDCQRFPVDEDEVCRPTSPYGIHKRASELALDYYREVHGIATTALRFFNVFGPRQDPSSAYSGVISLFAARAAARQELVIFGDGQQTRDFVYVGDVARAVADAALSPPSHGGPYNLGTGHEITVRALAEQVLAATGSPSQLRHAAARPGEIRRSVARVDRAQRQLGFTAEVSFSQGLGQTLDWYRGR
jgi:UDP-glucose 4-epimerase